MKIKGWIPYVQWYYIHFFKEIFFCTRQLLDPAKFSSMPLYKSGEKNLECSRQYIRVFKVHLLVVRGPECARTHCPKNIMNIRIKTEPVATAADATVCVRFFLYLHISGPETRYCIYRCIRSKIQIVFGTVCMIDKRPSLRSVHWAVDSWEQMLYFHNY